MAFDAEKAYGITGVLPDISEQSASNVLSKEGPVHGSDHSHPAEINYLTGPKLHFMTLGYSFHPPVAKKHNDFTNDRKGYA